MYQVNYTGLKKRETYDEIVALLDGGDKTKIKYPNRVASQILNSPYMKMIDADSLLDIQNQNDNIQKEKLKQILIQQMSNDSKIPNAILKAKVIPPKREFFSIHENDDIEDVRATIGGDLSNIEIQRMAKRQQIAQSVDKAVDQTPISREATGIQVGYGVSDKHTQTSQYRYPSDVEETGIDYGKELEKAKQQIAEMNRKIHGTAKQSRAQQERQAHSKIGQSRQKASLASSSSIAQIAKTVGTGLSSFFGSKDEPEYKSDTPSVKSEYKSETPKKSEPKSEIKSSIKSEPKSSIGYYNDMAQPVLPVNKSRTPSRKSGSIKSEPISSISHKRGYAQPVEIVSGNASVRSESRSSRSSKSKKSGYALPVKAEPSLQSIHSSVSRPVSSRGGRKSSMHSIQTINSSSSK
jgi:hypothetical protein